MTSHNAKELIINLIKHNNYSEPIAVKDAVVLNREIPKSMHPTEVLAEFGLPPCFLKFWKSKDKTKSKEIKPNNNG